MANDNLNEDWVKVGRWDLPTDLVTLGQVLGLGLKPTPAEVKATFTKFLQLPASRAMPPYLRPLVERAAETGAYKSSRFVTHLRHLRRT